MKRLIADMNRFICQYGLTNLLLTPEGRDFLNNFEMLVDKAKKDDTLPP